MKIDDKYKWLARDKNGKLFAFENKPNKMTVLWFPITGQWEEIFETDERFSFVRWLDNNPIKISNIGNILALDSKEDYPSGNKYNPLGISVEEAIKSIRLLDRVGIYDSNDIISKPSHYIGINGLEVEEVTQNFLPRYTDGYVSHRVGSAIEYLLRAPLKNGLEDIEKAKENLQQIIDYEKGKSKPLELDGNESDVLTYYGGTNLGD